MWQENSSSASHKLNLWNRFAKNSEIILTETAQSANTHNGTPDDPVPANPLPRKTCEKGFCWDLGSDPHPISARLIMGKTLEQTQSDPSRASTLQHKKEPRKCIGTPLTLSHHQSKRRTTEKRDITRAVRRRNSLGSARSDQRTNAARWTPGGRGQGLFHQAPTNRQSRRPGILKGQSPAIKGPTTQSRSTGLWDPERPRSAHVTGRPRPLHNRAGTTLCKRYSAPDVHV